MSALYRALFIIFIVNSITLLVRVHVHIVNVTYVAINGSYGNRITENVCGVFARTLVHYVAHKQRERLLITIYTFS